MLHSASYTSIFENPEIKMKPGEFWLMLLSPTSIQVVLILAVHKTYRNGLRPLPVLPLRNVEAFTYRPFDQELDVTQFTSDRPLVSRDPLHCVAVLHPTMMSLDCSQQPHKLALDQWLATTLMTEVEQHASAYWDSINE